MGGGPTGGRASCRGPELLEGSSRGEPRVQVLSLEGVSGARPTLWASPTHPGSPPPKRLTHGPQVGPRRRAVRGWLAHQLVDRGQLVDTPMHFVHGREDRPVGRGLQVAPA